MDERNQIKKLIMDIAKEAGIIGLANKIIELLVKILEKLHWSDEK